jgi:hypothetical protein
MVKGRKLRPFFFIFGKNLVMRISILPALLIGSLSFAQSDVYLQINHQLGEVPFAFDTEVTNNLGDNFSVDRMEYYLSEITLVHDGGMETSVPDTWVLVDGGVFTNIYLGSYDLISLEGIRFGVGVDPEHNHEDPSTYPSDHPLAPKSPSMHWGWAAGYRFVAMEGKSGAGLAQTFQIHALGDVNYRLTEINTSGTWNEGVLYVALDGDYTMALKDISVAGGLINHGETGESITCMWNFNTDVFKAGEATVALALSDVAASTTMWMAPNPAQNSVHIQLNDLIPATASLIITDMQGKQVGQLPVYKQMQIDLSAYAAGLYQVSVVDDGRMLAAQQLFINK